MTLDAVIRDAGESDRDAIKDVTLAAYEEFAGLLRPEHWNAYLDYIVATLDEPGVVDSIVAELDGSVVGSVLFYQNGVTMAMPDGQEVGLGTPYARLLAVAPSARGQGIGAALMQECVWRARQSGAPVLTLHTTDWMKSAVRIYERMGFHHSPELDYRPVPEILIKGYALLLSPP